MLPLRLDFPVHTKDNRLLLPAGTILSADAIKALINKGLQPIQTYGLLNYKTVRADILGFFSHERYQLIFADPQRTQRLLSLMEEVRLPVPLLESLYYFKNHDHYTYRHLLIVFAISTLLAQDLTTDPEQLIQEVIAGPAHDIGKICVPPEILKKSKPMTPLDRKALHHHAIAGYVLLSYYFQDSQSLAARAARDHHERRDGSGYPAGIHLKDRVVDIIAVSDIYDALISPRPYRPESYDNRTALEEITMMAEKGKVSWEAVQTLVSHNRKTQPHYTACKVSREKRGIPPEDNLYGKTTKR
jgi:HD-GYP domain-containing protein (c-di-GMP phosphodiesterase class II)